MVPNITIIQDNKSKILQAEDGKTLSTKRTSHLNIRYICITINSEARVTDILVVFFTKLLQGTEFE